MSGRRLIEEDLFSRYSIVDNNSVEGQKIHKFLFERAKKLAGKCIDFDANPVTFVLSDDDAPNAFFCDIFDPEKAPRPSDYETPRYVRNHLETPVIAITRGLIDMVDNIDELDYVLGHELTHMLMRGYGIERNSKGEEEIADLHAVDLVYDAGSDPKQALAMTEKFGEYAKQKRKENRMSHRRWRDDKDDGINWSEILDVHMTGDNRKAAIEASLTRLSHLIDDRKPTPFDKSIFDADYSDPVDAFLKEQGFEDQKSLGKLKILVDCVAHISSLIPAKEFFDAELAALPENPDRFDWETADKMKAIHERIESGYKKYFHGPTIEKKYQQKIARLAEKTIAEFERERQKGGPHKPAAVNATDLQVYLEDQAYEHIVEHGYPVIGDYNYDAAAGILYSYFYCLFENNSHANRKPRRLRDMFDDREVEPKRVRPKVETDLDAIKNTIRSTDNFDEFSEAVARFNSLTNIIHEVRTIEYGQNGSYEKLYNLSGVKSYRYTFREDKEVRKIYSEPEAETPLPWNNLYDVAQSSDKAREAVASFLDSHNLTDYRITRGMPYVQLGRGDGYIVDENGVTSKDKIPAYQISYEVHKDTVKAAYDYVEAYFDDEDTIIEQVCTDVLGITDEDYKEPNETLSDNFNRNTVAHKKIYDFVSMFNALPDESDEADHFSDNKVVEMIPERYRKDNLMPGSQQSKSSFREHIVYDFDSDLLKFDNPIFQDHFGEDYKEELTLKKITQHDRMFETVFALFQQSIDNSIDSRAKREALNAEEEAYWEEVESTGESRWDHKKSDRIKAIRDEQEFNKVKLLQAESIIFNFLNSIFEREQYWYNLQRLTDKQCSALAEYAVRDEKGEIKKTIRSEKYELICDFLDILEHQTDQVMRGDYSLTPMMKIVADNHGYVAPKTNEDRVKLAEKGLDVKYGRGESQYLWYLQIFDAMSVLETGPTIDVRSFVTAISEIIDKDRSRGSEVPYEISKKRTKNLYKLLEQSKVLDFASQAIGHQDNYDDLFFDDTILTLDSLISLKKALQPRLEKSKDQHSVSGEKRYFEPQHMALFDVIDKNVGDLLRKVEDMALANPDRLQTMEQLYKAYNEYSKYSSSERKRSPYLSILIDDEKRLEKLSQSAESKEFWPDDALDHVKAYVFAKNTFIDDKEFENKLLNEILDKVGALPSGKMKNSCLHILLDQNLRAPYPDTRERLFEIYTDDIHEKLGDDNTSEQYQGRLSLYLKSFDVSDMDDERKRKFKYRKDWDIGYNHGLCNGLLTNQISSADKYILLRKLADKIISQEETSKILKEACQINLKSDDMLRSYLYGIGVDYLTEEMDRDADTANRFVKFLNSKGESKECKEISKHIQERAELRLSNRDPKYLREVRKNTQPSNFSILYENFWSAPLEARAVIIARMLKSAVADNEDEDNQQLWERVFDVVMDNLIAPDDNSTEAQYSRETMHSYIKAKSDYERELILSAMMVANRNLGGETGNIGKGLRFFLENSGPAEIKAGQAGGSHPNTPTQIGAELQELKNNANTPARWTVYDWIKDENIPEEYWKDQHLGKIRAASYYATIELGDDEILRLLVPEAREKAKKGFRVLGDTIEDLKEKDAVSDLDFGELTTSVQQMITQASKMSDIETDHEIGAQQCADVKEICDGVQITSGAQTFDVKVMDWKVKGKNWIIMQRAQGPVFNELPATTPQEISYKTDFAKGYITFQIGNILSGGKFDHDTHGANLCVDPKTNIVGLFDTGAMALNDPTHEEQRLLGHVLYDAIKLTMSGEKSFSVFSRSISDKIDELHAQGTDTKYLVEVKKEILALGDFFKVLDASNVKEIMPDLSILDDIAAPIREGIFERMTSVEKASLKALSATNAFKRNNSTVVIDKSNTGVSTKQNVVDVDIAPTVKDKAAWLDQAFADTKDQKGKSNPTALIKLCV